jgi:hypothetical protein
MILLLRMDAVWQTIEEPDRTKRGADGNIYVKAIPKHGERFLWKINAESSM